MISRAPLAALCAFALSAHCAGPSLRVEGEGLDCTLRAESADAPDLPALRAVLREASGRVRRWGPFPYPLELRVVRDHPALEAAVERPGLAWLRAWTFPSRILLQSPRSWPESAALSPADARAALTELLAHELAHALMYQLLAPVDPAHGARTLDEPPLWFREGFASVTADQEHRRMPRAQLALWLASHGDANLLDPAPALLRDEKDALYGAAHHSFARWLSQVRERGVLELLSRIRAGLPFAAAFAEVTGEPQEAFMSRARASGFAPE